MSEEDPGNERRPWRTDSEWQRLSERIRAAEPSADVERASRNIVPAWRRAPSWFVTGLAAVLIGVASATLLHHTASRDEPRIVATGRGERVTIHLADSSVVTLGPASTVRYLLTDTSRTLELVGLANFDVRHDARRPFVVKARNTKTVDIGTTFVIRAYASDSVVTVAVTSGRVAVRASEAGAPRDLDAGTVGTVAANGAISLLRADASLYAAWTEGRLVFRDVPLSQVVAELSRTFDADIRIPDSTLSHRRVSGIYSDASLSGVLEALSAILGAHVERRGHTVTILPRVR
ncbi:MAG: FecR domain-containing protein [bacterium]